MLRRSNLILKEDIQQRSQGSYLTNFTNILQPMCYIKQKPTENVCVLVAGHFKSVFNWSPDTV